MQVLEDEDQGRLPGGELERGAPGGEQARAVHRLRFANHTDGCTQQLREPVGLLGSGVAHPVVDGLAHGGRRRVVSNSDQPKEHGPQRPVGEPLPVWQTLGHRHVGMLVEPRQSI